MKFGIALAAVLTLSACVGAGVRPMPLAESGPVAVDVAGQAYIADLQPSDAGAVLAMTRDPKPFGYDEGAEAKRAASMFCSNRQTRLSPRALGEFANGTWVFKGGCA